MTRTEEQKKHLSAECSIMKTGVHSSSRCTPDMGDKDAA